MHAHLSTAALHAGLASRITGVPSLAAVHGLNQTIWYRFPTGLLAVSLAVAEHLARAGIACDRVRIVRTGVPLRDVPPAPAARAALSLIESPTLGVFARLYPEKGVDVAIRALAKVRGPERPRLLVVGAGRESERLKAMAEQAGVTGRTLFVGFQPNVSDWMAACDAVLAPSRREALGLSAVEAMAAGRPVIASRTGGLVEVTRGGEAGLLVPPDDPDALASAASELLCNPVRAAALVAAGREWVAAEFDPGRSLSALGQALTQTASPSR
jgi:glycosyltransferase involved in cell wall biosynthesis